MIMLSCPLSKGNATKARRRHEDVVQRIQDFGTGWGETQVKYGMFVKCIMELEYTSDNFQNDEFHLLRYDAV
jgi:hypothetical protein